jgi:hypothetical protein
MNIELSTPALLFPAIAILMLGYVNRYVSVAMLLGHSKKITTPAISTTT